MSKWPEPHLDDRNRDSLAIEVDVSLTGKHVP